jgi:hypothetical protein
MQVRPGHLGAHESMEMLGIISVLRYKGCLMHAPLTPGGVLPCLCNPPWRARRCPTRSTPQVLHALVTLRRPQGLGGAQLPLGQSWRLANSAPAAMDRILAQPMSG